MSYVYVLTSQWYGSTETLGVFATVEGAKVAAERDDRPKSTTLKLKWRDGEGDDGKKFGWANGKRSTYEIDAFPLQP